MTKSEEATEYAIEQLKGADISGYSPVEWARVTMVLADAERLRAQARLNDAKAGIWKGIGMLLSSLLDEIVAEVKAAAKKGAGT